MKLKYIYGGPKVTFSGSVTNYTYKVYGDDEFKVDERDAEGFLSLHKHGRKYFELVEEKMVADAEQYGVGADLASDEDKTVVQVVEATDEDIANVIDYEDDFTIIDGIGDSLSARIHDNGVHTFEDLYLLGEEWIADLPRVSDEKASSIYKQVKVELEKLKILGE